MPYIITTTRSRPQFVLPPTGQVTRRARATIQEARDDARDDCFERDYDTDAIAPCIAKAESLPEPGGIITLPDGTVIKVTYSRWIDLIPKDHTWPTSLAMRADGELGGPKKQAEAREWIIDAYNAAQS